MSNASPRSSLTYQQEPRVIERPWDLEIKIGNDCPMTEALAFAKAWGCGIKYTGSNEILITHPLHHKRLIHSAHRRGASVALVSFLRAVVKLTLNKAGPRPMTVAPAAGGLDPVDKFRQMKLAAVKAPEPTPAEVSRVTVPEPEKPKLELKQVAQPSLPVVNGRAMANSAVRQIDELVYKYHYSCAHLGTFRECSDPHCEGARAAFKTIKSMGQKIEAAVASKNENEELFIAASDENERLRETVSKLTDQVRELSEQMEKSTPKAPPSPGKVQLYATSDGHGNVYALGSQLFKASDFPEEHDNLDYRRTKYDLLLRGLRNALDQVWIGEARSLTNFIDGLEMLIMESKYSLSFIPHFKTLNFNTLMPKLGNLRRPGGERNMIGPLAARVIRESLEKLRNG